MEKALTSPPDTRSLLNESVFLAIASAYVYFITFVYEYGFCRHFDIPASLIAPNVSTFLVAAVALGVTLLPALQLLAFTTPLFKAARDPKRRAYRDVYAYTAVLLVAGILLAAIYGVSLAGAALYVCSSLAFLAFLFLPAILSNRHLPIPERLSKHADIQDKDPFVATNLFEGWLSYRHMRIGLVALVALGVAYLVGDAEARKKELFVLLKADQDVVLLRTYGDLLIFAEIDKLAHVQSLRLMWLSEKKELDLVTRKVGPITPNPRQSIKQNEAASVPRAAPSASAISGTVASRPAK
jgi:hypothetical protein